MKGCKGLNRAYWLYWVASAWASAASNILQYILSLYVLEVTGSGTLFASMFSIIIVPRLIITPFAGVIADQTKKIRLMSWILFYEAIVLVFYMLLGNIITFNILLIYLLVIVLEIGEIFYGASAAAIIPELVSEEQIKDAVAISKVDDGIVVVLSPMVAALIYTKVELQFAFGIVALINLVACIMQKLIVPQYEHTRQEKNEQQTIWTDFKEGLVYIRKDSFIYSFIKVLPIINAFFGATFSVSIMYLLRESFKLDAYAYGLYCSVTSSISIIVPLVVIPIVKKYSAAKVFAVSTLLISIEIVGIGMFAYLGLKQYLPVILAVIIITILDCMTIAEAIPMQMAASILIQTGVEKQMLGRVSSVIKMISVSSVAIGEMAFGILIDLTNVWLPIFIGAVGVGSASALYRKKMKYIKSK